MDCNTESLTADGSISSPQSGKKTRLNSALAVDKLDRELGKLLFCCSRIHVVHGYDCGQV